MDRNNADVMKKMQYILNMRPVLNTEALFSDGSDYYRCPSNPKAGDKVRIRFRTKRNNVDMVYLVYDGNRWSVWPNPMDLIIMRLLLLWERRLSVTILRSHTDG